MADSGKPAFQRQGEQLSRIEVVEAEAASAPPCGIVGVGLSGVLAAAQAVPEDFQLFVQLVSDACRAATGTVVSDADARGLADDAARIELSEGRRNATHEVPRGPAAGEKVGHGAARL